MIMSKELQNKIEQEIYNEFGIPPEVFKDGSPNKESAEIQLSKFIELNKF